MDTNLMQAKLDEIAAVAKEKFKTPSVAVSVYAKGNEFYSSCGFSDVENNVKAKKDTVYAIASASKAFIATSVCMLCQEGKIDLDQSIQTYLPDFKMYNDYLTANLTVRDALSHRTGMSRNDLTWYMNPDRTISEMVHILRYLPPAYAPRYRMHYQNHMFTLATLLVETVSGIPWKDFLKNRIFIPLGMKNTYASGNLLRDDTEQKARPYRLNGEEVIQIPYRYLDNVGCTGSIYSTTEDLIKWAKFHLLGDEGLLSREYLVQLHRPHTVINPGDFSIVSYAPEVDFEAYAMGWFVESYRGHKMVHHGGTIDGFKSIVGFIPGQDIAFSVLSNLNRNQSPSALSYMIADLFMDLAPVDWPARVLEQHGLLAEQEAQRFFKSQKAAEEKKQPCGCLPDYPGNYHNPAFGEIAFGHKDDRLYLNILNTAIPLECIGKDLFMPVSKEVPDFIDIFQPIAFSRDSNGAITKTFVVMDDKVTTPFAFVRR